MRAQRREELRLLAEPRGLLAQREKAVASHKAGEGDTAQPAPQDTKGRVLLSGDGETVGVLSRGVFALGLFIF